MGVVVIVDQYSKQNYSVDAWNDGVYDVRSRVDVKKNSEGYTGEERSNE